MTREACRLLVWVYSPTCVWSTITVGPTALSSSTMASTYSKQWCVPGCVPGVYQGVYQGVPVPPKEAAGTKVVAIVL